MIFRAKKLIYYNRVYQLSRPCFIHKLIRSTVKSYSNVHLNYWSLIWFNELPKYLLQNLQLDGRPLEVLEEGGVEFDNTIYNFGFKKVKVIFFLGGGGRQTFPHFNFSNKKTKKIVINLSRTYEKLPCKIKQISCYLNIRISTRSIYLFAFFSIS